MKNDLNSDFNRKKYFLFQKSKKTQCIKILKIKNIQLANFQLVILCFYMFPTTYFRIKQVQIREKLNFILKKIKKNR